ncbi:hypothetical protein A6A08_12665 [Nocardiopsis sp. TSRI0078]|uniref:SCO7613 C-terminal domain-containing membrane protein n=1 Tax=unclassified Nocardiopsis TaxID=2649073 RepID=UPI00093B758A|nr:zinc ribbon domain-containing protein [Nocardiopsis sp. TSRI0078]OKI14433.1 hypothetical protein A6A08_12665 [Nocardiopsis sp. TSRI0078]
MNVHGSPPSPAGPEPRCPDCHAPLPVRPRSCPRCGLLLVGDTAQRLWRIDSEIALLDGRRQQLHGERAAVVGLLREESARAASRADAPAAVRAVGAPGAPGAVHAHGTAEAAGGREQRPPGPVPAAPEHLRAGAAHSPAHPAAAPSAGEVTRRSAQNIILGLGGLLVGIAALVFAIWTWSDMGTGARAGVLGITTAAFAALALPLHRRGLRATAETFGCLAAALLCVDALALWLLMSDRLGGGPGYTAGALAAIGALTALYPVLVPLRSPRVIAALMCQPVPVLLVFSLPFGTVWFWALPALAATALGDLLVARRLGDPRPGRPVRTLRTTAAVLWIATLLLTAVLVLAGPGSDVPRIRWALTAALLLSGATGLLLARRPLAATAAGKAAHTVTALLALGMAPLAAGPSHLPVLPRVPAAPWHGGPSAATDPVLQVLGLYGPTTGQAHGPALLATVLVGAALALGTAALLRRDALVPAAALVAPPTLLAFPLLLGLPHVVATVWALLVGAALVLGTALLPRHRTAWVPAATGVLTLVTGLLWSLPDRYTSLGALLFLGATALVAVLLYRRTAPGEAPATVLYGAGLLLWSLALLTGAFLLLGLVISEAVPPPAWWLVAGAGLLAGATALVLGRVPAPSAPADRSAPDPRTLFTLLGLLLLATAPLLAGRAQGPGLPLLPRVEPWSEPVSAMWEPAYPVLGLSAQADAAAAVGTAAGVLAAGAAAVALVRLLDRRRTAAAVALAVPTALVPLPLILGMPYVVAVVWTVLVGAALVLGAAPAARHGSGRVPAVSGLLTLVLGLLWALPEWYTTLVALMLVAATAQAESLVLRRLGLRRTGGPVPLVYAVTLALGALALSTGLVALASTFAADAVADPVSWWLLGAALLLVASASTVLGQVPCPWVPDASAPAPAGPRPAPVVSPFTVVGMLLLACVPLVVGPRTLPALALFSRARPPASAPPSALTESAHAFLGLAGPPPAAVAVAVGVLVSGLLAAGVAALLARRWAPHTAALVAPPALAPLPVVLDAPFLAALVWAFAVGSALVLWSALARDRWVGRLAGATGLLTLVLGLSWALAQEHANTGALMAVAVVGAVAAALARTTVPMVGATAVATAATGAFALALPLLLGAPVEYAALAPIAMVAAVAVAAPRLRGPLVLAAEVPACLWAVVALVVTVSAGARPELVALALAVVGVVALATAVRPNRRWSALVGTLLMFAALWTVLAAWNVAAPEAYTVPPALAALAVGWEWSRKAAEAPSSWAAYGGGLMLLFLPTVVLVLLDGDMVWRVPAVLVLGLAVVVWGLRRQLQAALVLGGLVLVATSLRAFGPPLWDLTRLVPNWLPFAVAGVLLLVIGARYEASLERLRRLGRLVMGMR